MEKCSARSNANTGAACFYLFKDPNAGLRMSALGQKQTCAAHKPMSAKCQKQTFPIHSMTSSARASSDSGPVMPSALAVLRLITKSYLVET